MLKHLVDIIYPRTCLGCNDLLKTGEVILCTKCRHNLPLTNHHLEKENEAYKRIAGRFPLENAMSMLIFEKHGIVQQIIHNLKYRGHQEIGTFLGDWYGEIIGDKLHNINEIIPVPLHKRRFRKRGFNQVITFCNSISRSLKIPINEKILFRNKYSKSQTKKTLFYRTYIDKNIFDVKFSERDFEKHFLLIDDVLTSGTTIEQCSKTLLKIPKSKISILTMAITF